MIDLAKSHLLPRCSATGLDVLTVRRPPRTGTDDFQVAGIDVGIIPAGARTHAHKNARETICGKTNSCSGARNTYEDIVAAFNGPGIRR